MAAVFREKIRRNNTKYHSCRSKWLKIDDIDMNLHVFCVTESRNYSFRTVLKLLKSKMAAILIKTRWFSNIYAKRSINSDLHWANVSIKHFILPVFFRAHAKCLYSKRPDTCPPVGLFLVFFWSPAGLLSIYIKHESCVCVCMYVCVFAISSATKSPTFMKFGL